MASPSEIGIDIDDLAEEFEVDFTENNNLLLNPEDSDYSDEDYSPEDNLESSPSTSVSDISLQSDDIPLANIARRGSVRGRGNSRKRGHSTRGRGRGQSTRGRGHSTRGRSGSNTRGRGRIRRAQEEVLVESEQEQVGSIDQAPSDWSPVDDFTPKTVVPFTEPAYLPLDTCNFCEYDYFKQYIDTDLVHLIVQKTNQQYAITKEKQLGLTVPEFYKFLEASLIMSAINYPILRMYWEKNYKLNAVAENISRDSFLLLRNCIKLVVDRDVPQEVRINDKIWKVSPLVDKIKKACRKVVKEHTFSIDEMIVPFSGGCSIRQYCPGKPNPTGLKIFVLANPSGLVCDFDVYQGGSTYPNYDDTNFSLGDKAVLKLTENLILGHLLYFDRYFTTAKLLNELTNRNLMGAGTIMKNRIPKDATPMLKADRALMKEGRGALDVVAKKGNSLALVKWLDNKPILLMSNVHGKEPKDVCKRWSKNLNAYIYVERPYIVKAYNSNMGGVDLADRLLAVCPNRHRTRKWTQRFICHMIDLAVCNSWIQYRQDQVARNVPTKDILQLRAFKMAIGTSILDAYADTLGLRILNASKIMNQILLDDGEEKLLFLHLQ